MKRNITLDKEEQAIQASIDRDEWQSVENFSQEKSRYEQIAHATINKTRRVNLRLTEHDYQAAQIRAIEEELPYQTLHSSVIHKFIRDITLLTQLTQNSIQ
jgi:predicted DNA binding CopG/RHH family protein